MSSVNFNAGRLIVNGGATATASGTGVGFVTNFVGGTLCGTGTLGQVGRTGLTLTVIGDSGATNLETKNTSGTIVTNVYTNMSTVAPGGVAANNTSLVGTLRVNGNVALLNYSRLAIDLGGANTSDCLTVTGRVDIHATGTVLDLTLPSGTKLSGPYTLLTCGTLAGTFANVMYNGSPVPSPTVPGAFGGTYALAYRNGSLQLAPIGGTVLLLR